MKIYLIRHTQSLGNVNKEHYLENPTHLTELSWLGIDQAFEVGKKLKEYHLKECEKEYDNSIRLKLGQHNIFCSPYKRAIDTFKFMLKGYYTEKSYGDFDVFEQSIVEYPELSEQQFGLFDGLSDEKMEKLFPKEYFTYKHNGPFYGKIPQGESKFDIYNRVATITDKLLNSNYDCVVVSHATTLKILTMRLLNKSIKWLDEEPLQNNGSIRLIDKSNYTKRIYDKGFIFDGFSAEK